MGSELVVTNQLVPTENIKDEFQIIIGIDGKKAVIPHVHSIKYVQPSISSMNYFVQNQNGLMSKHFKDYDFLSEIERMNEALPDRYKPHIALMEFKRALTVGYICKNHTAHKILNTQGYAVPCDEWVKQAKKWYGLTHQEVVSRRNITFIVYTYKFQALAYYEQTLERNGAQCLVDMLKELTAHDKGVPFEQYIDEWSKKIMQEMGMHL